MKKVFLYPNNDKTVGSPNPYIENFQNALSKNYEVVNKKSTNRGALNLVLFFKNTDIFILNWIENLPEKKWGIAQSIIFLGFLLIVKFSKKKIIWIMHNKKSHHKSKNIWFDFLFKSMLKSSDTIITHSNSGLDFIKSTYPDYAFKIKVLIHPIEKLYPSSCKNKNYDFIIWGSVFPYKGIDKFLSYLIENPSLQNSKILIVGKCFDQKYKKYLEDLMPVNVTFMDQIFSLDEIEKLSRQSKFTLFTYKPDSVISSGSLIDAIRMGSFIIGPDHGAFKDLNHLCFIETYNDFGEIFDIRENFSVSIENDLRERQNFYIDNNWDVFIDKLENYLNKN